MAAPQAALVVALRPELVAVVNAAFDRRFLVLLREHPYVKQLEAVRYAAAELANAATGSGETGISCIPNDLLWHLNGELEKSA